MKLHSLIKTAALTALLATTVHAAGDIGCGWVLPNDQAFESGFFSLYADFAGKAEKRVTWRAGADFNYGIRPFDGELPDLTYTALNLRGSLLWRPFATKEKPGGLQLGAGPSFIMSHLRRETPGSGGGSSGVNIIYRGSGGVSNLWAGLMNNIGGSSTYIADQVVNTSDSQVGGHAFIGYAAGFWHVEIMYEQATSKLMKLGGTSFRFGFSF